VSDEAKIVGDDVIRRLMIPVEKFRPAEYNPNMMNDEEMNLLVETIQDVGFIDPVTAVELEDGTFGIIGGEHRWKAACRLNLKEIPADVLQGERWKDEDLRKLQNVRLNVIHGKMDPEKMLKLYNEMASKYGEKAVRLLGYTSDAGLKKIVKNVAKEMRNSLPPEMAKEFEEKAKEARTVNDLERIIQHLFQEHGDSLQFNYMAFAWGGKEHVYIAMSKKVHEAMKKIMSLSRKVAVDINEMIGDAIVDIAEALEEAEKGSTNGNDRRDHSQA
jgi:hypothetical protein